MSKADEADHSRGWGGVWLLVLAFVFLGLFRLYGIDDAWFAQNNHNRRFVEGESFLASLTEYRKTWPPLYPSLLYGWTKLGLSPDWLNAALGVVSIALVARLSRRLLPNTSGFWPALAWAVWGPHALIARQLVAEELLCVLTLAGLDLALSYRVSRALRHLVPLALFGAGIALTRYFGALWLLVPAGLFVLASPGGLARRLGHAALLTSLSVGLSGPWFLHVYGETGYPTGIDRFDRSPEGRMAGQLHTITPQANLEAIAETLYIDGLSAHDYAKARRGTYAAGGSDGLVLALVGGCVGALCVARLRARKWAAPSADRELASFVRGLWCVGAWFFVLVFVLWSTGNNDPINTRFLYPVYPLLVLVGAERFAALQVGAGRVEVAALRGLFVVFLVVQCLRHAGLG